MVKEAAGDNDCSPWLVWEIAKNHETVRGKKEGSDRSGVRFHSSSKERGFEGALVGNLAKIEAILESFETTALYNLLFSNCQHEVSEWQRALAESSLSLLFHVPGGGTPIPIGDERIVGVVEDVIGLFRLGKQTRQVGVDGLLLRLPGNGGIALR